MSQDKGAPLPDHFKTNERRRDEFYLEKNPQLVCCSPAGSMPYFGSMWPLLPSGGSKDFVLDKCNGGEAEFTKSSVHFNSLTPMWVSSVVLLFCFIALNCTVKAAGTQVFKTLKVHFMEY